MPLFSFCVTFCILHQHAGVVVAHTWMFSQGRAWMQASLQKPFRARGSTEGGQGTHAQFGPNQHMVVRWASSHNNTFSLAVVAAADEKWFFHEQYYTFLDDYIDSAPADANEAVAKPRYHGAASRCSYLNTATNTACAGGYCIKDLFEREVTQSDPACETHAFSLLFLAVLFVGCTYSAGYSCRCIFGL